MEDKIIVIITSKNPVKINAVKNGFKKMFSKKEFKFEDIIVSSEVSDQPMTDEETRKGAENRIKNAMKEKPEANYWVGLEGGINEYKTGELKGEMETYAWIMIKSKENKIGKAKTGTLFLPKKVIELIKQGKELGDANDIIFKQENSKQKGGAIGTLTNNLLTRTSGYERAIITALIPFKKPELY